MGNGFVRGQTVRGREQEPFRCCRRQGGGAHGEAGTAHSVAGRAGREAGGRTEQGEAGTLKAWGSGRTAASCNACEATAHSLLGTP